MKALRRFLVLFVAWAYAFQAVTAVAATAGCGHEDAHAAPHEATLAVSTHAHGHDAPPAHHPDDALADDDCDHCPSCDHQGCGCGDHGCNSSPGIASGRLLSDALARSERFSPLSTQSPLPPFSRGLIRPPSLS